MNADRYISSASIDIKTITREIERARCLYAIDPHILKDNMSLRLFTDQLTQKMIADLMLKVASKKFDVKTVRFPDGAWHAIKHALQGSRWMMYQFVRTWLKNHPVRYQEVTMEANAYHPDIAFPITKLSFKSTSNPKRTITDELSQTHPSLPRQVRYVV